MPSPLPSPGVPGEGEMRSPIRCVNFSFTHRTKKAPGLTRGRLRSVMHREVENSPQLFPVLASGSLGTMLGGVMSAITVTFTFV